MKVVQVQNIEDIKEGAITLNKCYLIGVNLLQNFEYIYNNFNDF